MTIKPMTSKIKKPAKKRMNKADKLKMCSGCRDNFYNGNNNLGVKECWKLPSAKVVMRKKVGLWQTPPWKQAPIKVLHCRHEEGYVFTDPKSEY